MKKALAGPAKRTAKKEPERRAMIAAKRRHDRVRGALLVHATKKAPRRLDSWANGLLVRAEKPLARLGRTLRTLAGRLVRRLRPLGVLLFRLLGRGERLLLGLARRGQRAATRASALLTPWRGICLAVLAAAGCLVASQFVEYRAIEVGQPGYAGLPTASAPAVGGETAGAAHAYLLVPAGLLAAALALAALRDERRARLGRAIFALGLLSLAVALLVDLPAGRDVGAEAARFAAAKAVLYDGFYAEIAAAAGLMLGGMLLLVAPKATARYYARPCRTRINLFGRAASGLRRRRRRRASSRAKGARRGSRRRSGAVSAPASPR
jgi:hypothetical protein